MPPSSVGIAVALRAITRITIESIQLAVWRRIIARFKSSKLYSGHSPISRGRGGRYTPGCHSRCASRCIAGWRANYDLSSEWVIIVVNSDARMFSRCVARYTREEIEREYIPACRTTFLIGHISPAVTIIKRIELCVHVSNNHRLRPLPKRARSERFR